MSNFLTIRKNIQPIVLPSTEEVISFGGHLCSPRTPEEPEDYMCLEDIESYFNNYNMKKPLLENIPANITSKL